MPALLILAALAALIYLLRYAARPDGTHDWPGSAIKTLSTAALAAHGAANGAPGLIVAGLALGALGDFALSRPGQAAFLAGMAAFAAGHLAYGAALWPMAGALTPWHIAGLGLLVALVASTEIWLAPRTGDLRLPVRLYGLIIGAMAATALTMAPAPGAGLLRLGAALFVASDVLLALRLFVVTATPAKRALSYALWPAYWLGQALILAGAMAHG